MSGDGVSPGASPFVCPYCGEDDLRPEEEPGTWHCQACARVFALRLIRVDRGVVKGVEAWRSGTR